MLAAVFIAGIGVWWSGNNRQHKQLKRAGLVVLLFGVAWTVTNWGIDTPVEKVRKNTRQFIAAVLARDRSKLDTLLHPKAGLYQWGRQDIIDGATLYADQYGLKNAHITQLDIDAQQEKSGIITVLLTVFSEHESAMVPISTINSSWTLDWWQTDDGRWRLKDIKARKVGNMDMTEVNSRYFSNKPR